MFIKKVHKRYDGLRTGLKNQYSRGSNQYPEDLSAAYTMVYTYVKNPSSGGSSKN